MAYSMRWRKPPSPAQHNRICRHCGGVVLMVDTTDRGIVELNISERAYQLTETLSATGLTLARKTTGEHAAYNVHECEERRWRWQGGTL